MIEAIQTIFGTWVATANGTGASGLDLQYILAGVIFCICLIAFFSIVGIIIKKL